MSKDHSQVISQNSQQQSSICNSCCPKPHWSHQLLLQLQRAIVLIVFILVVSLSKEFSQQTSQFVLSILAKYRILIYKHCSHTNKMIQYHHRCHQISLQNCDQWRLHLAWQFLEAVSCITRPIYPTLRYITQSN